MAIIDYKEEPVTWDQFIEAVQRRIAGKCEPGATCNTRSMERGETGFFGTNSMDAAMRLARDGWREGTEQIAGALDALAPAEDVLPDWQLDAAGIMPCIPAFIAGEQECMWTRPDNVRPEHRITLITRLGYPCTISAQQTMNYGIAVAAVIRSLEASNVSPALYSMEMCKAPDSKSYIHGVMIRQHGEPLDLAKMAFSMHPSFLRRLDFAYREQSAGLAPVGAHGYGSVDEAWSKEILSHTPECGMRVVMPDIYHDLHGKGLLTYVPSLIEHLKEHVQKALREQTV